MDVLLLAQRYDLGRKVGYTLQQLTVALHQ